MKASFLTGAKSTFVKDKIAFEKVTKRLKLND
jgi:hypothetical protein